MTPTLAMIVQREAEIESFRPEPIYRLSIKCGGIIAMSERFEKKDEAEKILNILKEQKNAMVTKIDPVDKQEKKFYEAHRDEITLHKAAKEAFSRLPDGKIPKVKDLNEEFARLLSEKKAAYSEYKKIKKEMRDYQIAKQNVESFYAAQQTWDQEEDLKKKRQQQR